MLISAQGIVLRQRKIAGNRRILVLYTKEYGKISAGTSINEKGKSRSALSLRPFTFAEYEIFKGRDSYSINSANVLRSFYSIGEDLDRFTQASTFISYLDGVLQEGQAMPGLFSLSMEFLESISRAKEASETLLYAFIVKSLRMLGISPELGSCANCGNDLEDFGCEYKLFSISAGGVICEDCARLEKTLPGSLIYEPSFDIIEVFRYFAKQPLATFEKVKLRDETMAMIREIIAKYVQRYIGIDILVGS